MLRIGLGIIISSAVLYFGMGYLLESPQGVGANIGAGLVVVVSSIVFLVGAGLVVAGVIRQFLRRGSNTSQ